MLDYRIQTFLTLYEQMNYRKTAELLNMTQPGVTQHIHHLEAFYGVKLFSYNGRQLTRTAQAEQLKRHFDSIRAKERALKKDFVQKDAVHLRIGATKTIGSYVIVPAVQDFLSAPSHRLDLVVDNTAVLLHMLSRAELDFAVIEGVFDKETYPHRLFKRERFVGVCAKTHPFAGRTVPLGEVFREPLIVREPGSGTRRLLEQAIADRGYSLGHFRRCSSVSSFSVITALVADNGAITFAYAPVARSREDLAVFCVEDMEIRGEFNFVYADAEVALPKIALIFPDGIEPAAEGT